MEFVLPTPLQRLESNESLNAQIELWVKRDDLIHPMISGNKWRKLKYNLLVAKKGGFSKILTFGGAYSNHIAAIGAMAKDAEFEIHAIIRGEELNPHSNPTLSEAHENGIHLHFVDRSNYTRNKRVSRGSDVGEEWSDFFVIPEGGANEWGVQGCEEILQEVEEEFDYVCLSAGTGTTAAGILRSVDRAQVLVFPALKGGDFLEKDILAFQEDPIASAKQLRLFTQYHFGGYAKHQRELLEECKQLSTAYGIPLDYIYTAKAFMGLMDLMRKAYFEKGSKILFYHSGGLQANPSIEAQY